MRPISHFHFCPRCGERRPDKVPRETFACSACGFLYYFNPASAAAAFVLNPRGEALFIRRAKEPAQGKLAIPGGFVDFGETAEDALRREVQEEVNLELSSLEYLCSAPNEYHYREVTYLVLDLFFVARAKSVSGTAALDGVASYSWLMPAAVDPAELGFSSVRAALSVYLQRSHVG